MIILILYYIIKAKLVKKPHQITLKSTKQFLARFLSEFSSLVWQFYDWTHKLGLVIIVQTIELYCRKVNL